MEKKKGLPRWSELVLCTVNRITPYAAWCTLDEYENEDGSPIEGMIHVSQVAGRWVKDIRKFVKPNKQYVAKVIKIDREKGHLNLSIKRVTKFDKRDKLEGFRREKRGMGMVRQMSKLSKSKENDILAAIRPVTDEYDDIFASFEAINEDRSILDEAKLDKKMKSAILEIIDRNFKTKEKTVKVSLTMQSRASDGVVKIRKILAELEDEVGGTVKYISAANYRVELKSKDPKEAERAMKAGLEAAIKKVEKADGEGSYEFSR